MLRTYRLFQSFIFISALSLCQLSFANNQSRFQANVARAKAITKSMTTQQLIGQIALTDISMLTTNASGDNGDGKTEIDYPLIQQYQLGAIYIGGNDRPTAHAHFLLDQQNTNPHLFSHATLQNWQTMANKIRQYSDIHVRYYFHGKKQSVILTPLLGTDAVHGNQHIIGALTFPHNIGMAATHNLSLAKKEGFYTANSTLRSGFNWIYAPTVGLSVNPQWGRFYETLGSNPMVANQIAAAYVSGAQQWKQQHITGVLTTTKHYLGYSSGWSGIDEGNTVVTPAGMKNFIHVNTIPFIGAIEAGTGSIMPAYSAVNGKRMSFSGNLLTRLRVQHHFSGFYVSDQQAVDKANTNCGPAQTCVNAPHLTYAEAFAKSLHSGMNMFMLIGKSSAYKTLGHFYDTVQTALDKKLISKQDLQGAVTPIIAVKLSLSPAKPTLPRQAAYRAALQSAEQSLVLLKNQSHLLPLKKNIRHIILLGDQPTWLARKQSTVVFQSYHNLGALNGGWTISWQGFNGNDFQRNKNESATILQALQRSQQYDIHYLHYQSGQAHPNKVMQLAKQQAQAWAKQSHFNSNNTVIINVISENPYAEFMGDRNNPYCQPNLHRTDGCLYNLQNLTHNGMNPYAPAIQPANLIAKVSRIDDMVLHQFSHIPVVTVLLSGRPLVIDHQNATGTSLLSRSNALIAAWLPGNAGGAALVNAISGQYQFKSHRFRIAGKTYYSNTLPTPWISDRTQLSGFPIYNKKTNGLPRLNAPLFSMGYGLAT